jgi:hypothetical protein
MPVIAVRLDPGASRSQAYQPEPDVHPRRVPMHKHTVSRALEHTRGGQLRQARLITAHGPVDLDLIVIRRVTRTA